jgi:hypothetical protein
VQVPWTVPEVVVPTLKPCTLLAAAFDLPEPTAPRFVCLCDPFAPVRHGDEIYHPPRLSPACLPFLI